MNFFVINLNKRAPYKELFVTGLGYNIENVLKRPWNDAV
jgi:hypothetical protein